jgi:hypothetical protein
MMAMAAPRPKSPPSSPDPCGRHRLQLAVDTLHREIGFLEVGALSLDLRLDYTESDLFHSLIIFQQSFPLTPKALISSQFDAHQKRLKENNTIEREDIDEINLVNEITWRTQLVAGDQALILRAH